MASSALISSIHYVFDVLDLFLQRHVSIFHSMDFRKMRYKLMNIKIIVLSTRTFDNLESMRCLLVDIETHVYRIIEAIHQYSDSDRRWTFEDTSEFHSTFENVLEEIEPSLEKINEWYLTTLDDETPRSTSPSTDQVLEVIATCLGMLDYSVFKLKDFQVHHDYFSYLESQETLREELTFLKCLVCFARQRSVHPLTDLLSHVEAVAIHVLRSIIKSEKSTFSKQMKLFEEVHVAYLQSLRSAKFSRPSSLPPNDDMDDGDSSIAMTNILDYLISKLWERIAENSSRVDALKNDRHRDLFERLRSLRNILQTQSPISDMGIMEDIVAVVCDAGVLIFSSYHTGLDLGFEDLLQAIKNILEKFGEEDPHVPKFNFPKTNQLGFVDFVIEMLSELTSREPKVKTFVQTIQEELASLRVFLGEIAELRSTHQELQHLWDRVLDVAYRVEDLIDHLLVGDLPDHFSTSSSDFILKDMANIKEDALKTYHRKKGGEMEVKEVTKRVYQVPWQRTPPTTNEVIGFLDETSSIMNRLMRGSKHLRITAITGMPGLGKTTLASKVYNDPSIVNHFAVRAWSPISQVVDKRKILIDLLSQLIHDYEYSQVTEHDLADRLRRTLKGRKFLIFLDDMWHVEVWNSLEISFPDDNIGSRIILTSRHRDVAPGRMLDQAPLILNPLQKEDSLKLLQNKLIAANCWTPSSSDLLMQIAEICKGLPLTIVVIAGILTNTKIEDWKKILDDLSTGVVSSTENCRNTVDLSYRHLPDYLKPCLLYFGAFHEDDEISAKRLLSLWTAEGFVQRYETKRLQDVAEDYLNELIRRNLIFVSKRRWDGGINSCGIHDLIREFCQQRAKDEHFLHFLNGQNELLGFNEPHNLRRMCIFSEPKHFQQSKLFCPRARSLHFQHQQKDMLDHSLIDMSRILHNFKLLRVLDLEHIDIGPWFPPAMELLVQLAFLAIGGTFTLIPPWIDKLANLETFIVNLCWWWICVFFPDNLWNLQKLKNLHILCGEGILPLENLDSSSVLNEMDRLSGVYIPSEGSIETLMRKFPNIRILKCTVSQQNREEGKLDKFVIPDFLSQLQSVSLLSDPFVDIRMKKFCFTPEFCFPSHLRKLGISGLHLSGRNISIIGKLPNLEVLKMHSVEFEGDTWELNEGEFSKLRILSLYSEGLVGWRSCDDQFVQLEKLVLLYCKILEEMPACLESIPTLEMIEVRNCSEAVYNFVRTIEEVQNFFGNLDLKVIIESH